VPQKQLVAARTTVNLITELATVEKVIPDSAYEFQNLLHTLKRRKPHGRVPGESIRGDHLPPRRMQAEVLDRCSAVWVEACCVEVEGPTEAVPIRLRSAEVAADETGSLQSELESRERQKELEQQIAIERDIRQKPLAHVHSNVIYRPTFVDLIIRKDRPQAISRCY
jgi:hypothetical protein